MQRELRVGVVVLAALLTATVGIFLIGEKQHLFARTNEYTIRFRNVSGLDTGSPVQLNGVEVGRVEEVVLPEDPTDELLTVRIGIDRRYERRVRTDSVARIKTLGLLGDRYVEIASGSPTAEIVPSDGEIPAAPITDVDKIIESGGDVVDNIVAVSVALRNILERMERGEGLLGILATDTEGTQDAKESLLTIVNSFERLVLRVEQGEGSLGRLLQDDTLVRRLEEATGKLDGVLDEVATGEGLASALLRDGELKERTVETVAGLEDAVGELRGLTSDLREGHGLLQRLLSDEEYGERLTREILDLVEKLNLVADRVAEGEGSVARLINEPDVYEAVEDILVGVDESRLLRWLVRNRQKAGIEARYEETVEQAPPGAAPKAGDPD